MPWLFVSSTWVCLLSAQRNGIGHIMITLNSLKNLGTGLRMCLAHKKPSTVAGYRELKRIHPQAHCGFNQESCLYLACGLCPRGTSCMEYTIHIPLGKSCHFPSLHQSLQILTLRQIGASWVSSSFCFCFTASTFRKESSPWFHNSGIIYIVSAFDYALNFIPWNCNTLWVVSHLITKCKSCLYSFVQIDKWDCFVCFLTVIQNRWEQTLVHLCSLER